MLGWTPRSLYVWQRYIAPPIMLVVFFAVSYWRGFDGYTWVVPVLALSLYLVWNRAARDGRWLAAGVVNFLVLLVVVFHFYADVCAEVVGQMSIAQPR